MLLTPVLWRKGEGDGQSGDLRVPNSCDRVHNDGRLQWLSENEPDSDERAALDNRAGM